MSQTAVGESRADSRIFHIPSLDGIRAIAILIVFLSHAGLGKIIPGGVGVTIFFFLSGFLITTLLRREFEKNQSISLKKFYIRRALRIWPNFYFVLCIGAVFTLLGLIPGSIKIGPLLGQIFHFANYYSIFFGSEGTTIGSGVYWSLAVEEHFYLLFPFIYLILAKLNLSPRNQFLVLLLVSCALLAWRYFLVNSIGVPSYRTYYASDTRFDSLLFGCMLAIYGNPVLDIQQCSETKIKYIYVPAAILLLLFTVVYRSELFRETLRYSLQGIALFPLFIAAIRFPDWGVMRILNFKLVQFAGVLSYSFYLVHHTVIEVVIFYAHALPKLYIGLASLIASTILSYGLYLTVEVPFTRLRHKFA